MKRNKQPKNSGMKRTKPPKSKNESTGPKGGYLQGFMPNPPEDCIHSDNQVFFYGVWWIDNTFCADCRESKNCQRKKEYRQYIKEVGIPKPE